MVESWLALIDLIESHYPKASKKGGRPPYLLTTILRVHLLQQWYSLSDPAMEEALIELPEVGAFYWTVPTPDIVNPGREEQGSVSV